MVTSSRIFARVGFSLWMLFSGFLPVSGESESLSALTLIDQGEARSVIVYDQRNKAEAFAVEELQEIVEKSTGVELNAVGLDEAESLSAETLILVGRHALVSSAIGSEKLASLWAQESLVTSSGRNLVLTGGDDRGVRLVIGGRWGRSLNFLEIIT